MNWKPKSSPAALGKAPAVPAEVIDRETLAQWIVSTCKAFGAKLSTSYQVAGKVIEQLEKDTEGQMTIHGDTSPCIDREEQELCEWAYDGGDADTGVAGCWTCKTCGCVDINREPPSDPDADAYERNL